ncbi:MAG: hypothetical protein R3C11_16850 [Planctomycetaceae bacterium]
MRVIRANRKDYTKPIVQLLQNSYVLKRIPHADESITDLTDTELSVQQALPTPGKNEMSFSAELFEEF